MIKTKPIIYIVDDDKSICKALKRLMAFEGFEVETYTSAEDFLRCGYKNKPGILILDIKMPGMTGFELQEHLASSGSRIPIIFITAFNHAQTRNRTNKPEVIACLQKPFTDKDLLDAIHLAMNQDIFLEKK